MYYSCGALGYIQFSRGPSAERTQRSSAGGNAVPVPVRTMFLRHRVKPFYCYNAHKPRIFVFFFIRLRHWVRLGIFKINYINATVRTHLYCCERSPLVHFKWDKTTYNWYTIVLRLATTLLRKLSSFFFFAFDIVLCNVHLLSTGWRFIKLSRMVLNTFFCENYPFESYYPNSKMCRT